MKAKDFDKKFDEGHEDIIGDLDFRVVDALMSIFQLG